MADHKEVRYEHLYVKVPNSERIRDTAAGRLKRLLGAGWRETDRTRTPDYVRVRLEEAQAQQAFVLPQQAVSRSAQGDTVMVVGADGKVAPRPVKVGTAQGGQWIVLDGLKTGEQVMVDGFQKLRGPGPVKPVPWQPAASAAPPAASAASR